jgi:hypothetical protein
MATDSFTSPPASRSPDDAASCISNAPGPGQPSSLQPSGDSKRSQSLPADRSRRTTLTTTQGRGCRRDHACPPTIPNGRPRLRQSASDHARHPTTPQSPRVTVKTSARRYPLTATAQSGLRGGPVRVVTISSSRPAQLSTDRDDDASRGRLPSRLQPYVRRSPYGCSTGHPAGRFATSSRRLRLTSTITAA